MTRYIPEYPDGEYATEQPCDQEGCDGVVRYAIVVKDGKIPAEVRATCPECGHKHVRYRKGGNNYVKIHWWHWVLMVVYIVIVGPVVFADGYLWRALNPISVWLQKATGLSKYHLSLGAFVAGLLGMGVAEAADDGFGPLAMMLPILWGIWAVPYMRWCWRKIRSGAAGNEDEGDTRSLVDHKVIESTTFTRSFYMLFAVGTLPIFITSQDAFPVALMVLSVGYYWLDSDFVPPSKRKVLEMGRRWATGET